MAPLKGVEVIVYQLKDEKSQDVGIVYPVYSKTYTDDKGRYELIVERGYYRIEVHKDGYKPARSVDVYVDANETVNIDFKIKKLQTRKISGLVFEQKYLYPHNTIKSKSRILLINIFRVRVKRIPIENATIVVTKPRFIKTEKPFFYKTFTDRKGFFELSVEPGVYTMTISKEGYETVVRLINVSLNMFMNIKMDRLKLSLEILLDKNNSYMPGDPIYVKATLTNDYDHPITIAKPGCVYGSLDFKITTPDNRILHYIGPRIIKAGDPYFDIIILNPREKISIKVDITKYFGDKQGEYNFLKPGIYKIKGIYHTKFFPTYFFPTYTKEYHMAYIETEFQSFLMKTMPVPPIKSLQPVLTI